MRAKFKCESVTQYVSGEQANLSPVGVSGDENKSFAQYTPSGELKMMITNSTAQGFYKPGKSYYLDITEAPD